MQVQVHTEQVVEGNCCPCKVNKFSGHEVYATWFISPIDSKVNTCSAFGVPSLFTPAAHETRDIFASHLA